MTENWIEELKAVSNEEKAKVLSRFFKTGKGEYGEGDIFLGITVPVNRTISKRHFDEPLDVIKEILKNPIHEVRLSGLIALVEKYKKHKKERSEILKFYLDNCDACNNWDLVDLSAPYILGAHMLEHNCDEIIEELSNSDNFWRQRIAIVSTLALIRHHKFETALKLAKKYLISDEPLIHKATGWILREIGKKDLNTLRDFLDNNAAQMPRTALRYAIERMDKEEKVKYMAIKKEK